jgi:hypothetical protein
MAEGDTRSLHQIKRETERTRAGLTDTVEQLRSTVTDTATEIRDRLRPDAIKAEVSGYIKSRGEQFINDITDSARRNPIQAVAVGASVAYPLLRMARAIPMPILMIGAGLFFAGSKRGRDLTQTASDMAGDLADETRRRAHDIGDQVSRSASGAKDYATDALNHAGDALAEGTERVRRAGAEATGITRDDVNSTVDGLRETANAAGATVARRVGELKDRTAGLANSAAGKVQEAGAGAAATLRQVAADTSQAGQEFLSTARTRASEAGERTTRTMRETIEQNPILVAGVGLLIGGLIASALPKLDAENALLGDASAAVKKRAQEAASRGFDTAKGAAGEILTNVAQQAEKEGLTADGIARGAEDVGQRLQRVAERAVNTAFDTGTPNHDSGRGDHHG